MPSTPEHRRRGGASWMNDVPPNLYPKVIPSRWYLGTAGSCRCEGPGYYYVPCDWESDCVMALGLRVRLSGPKAPLPTPRPREPEVRTALYRLRDDDGALLYVGISTDPLNRWKQHAGDKPWWSYVASFSVEWFATRSEALAEEALAIRSEKPRHNVVHNAKPAANSERDEECHE